MPLALSTTVKPSIHVSGPPPLPAPVEADLNNAHQNGLNGAVTNTNGYSANGETPRQNGNAGLRKPPSKPRVWPSENGHMNGHTNGEISNKIKPLNGRPPMRPMKMNAPLTNGVTGKLIIRSNSAKSFDSHKKDQIFHQQQKQPTNHSRPATSSLKLPFSRCSTPDSRNGFSRESSIISRSPSPSISTSTRSISSFSSNGGQSYTSRLNEFRRSITPRRVFPQHYFNENHLDIHELHQLEQSPVIFDANLQFVMGCNKQRLHQSFRASPAHSEKETASNYLTDKISDFLNRTDHINEEWRLLGKKTFDDDTISMIEKQRSVDRKMNIVTKSRSAANIIFRGFQLISKQPPTTLSRANSIVRDDDECTIVDDSEVGTNITCLSYLSNVFLIKITPFA